MIICICIQLISMYFKLDFQASKFCFQTSARKKLENNMILLIKK